MLENIYHPNCRAPLLARLTAANRSDKCVLYSTRNTEHCQPCARARVRRSAHSRAHARAQSGREHLVNSYFHSARQLAQLRLRLSTVKCRGGGKAIQYASAASRAAHASARAMHVNPPQFGRLSYNRLVSLRRSGWGFPALMPCRVAAIKYSIARAMCFGMRLSVGSSGSRARARPPRHVTLCPCPCRYCIYPRACGAGARRAMGGRASKQHHPMLRLI